MSIKLAYWRRWLLVILLLGLYVAGSLWLWSNPAKILTKATTVPHLPVPIAREPVLVTVLGQGPGGVISNRLVSDLNIEHSFRHKAEYRDLSGYRTLLVVIDYNTFSMKGAFTNWEKEIQRVLNLVAVARGQGLRVIGVLCQPGPKLDTLWPYLDYLILIDTSPNQDWGMAGFQGLWSRVSNFEQAKIPLNSVFR